MNPFPACSPPWAHIVWWLGIVALIFAVAAWYRGNHSVGIGALLLGGGLLRLAFALAFPVLHQWDEQYHALVARNIADGHLFPPLLYPAQPLVLPETAWTHYHVWLHKPPLFLLLPALSLKLFGTDVLALRLPSILIATLTLYFVYGIGKHLHKSETGFWAAFMMAASIYFCLIPAGAAALDHNDTALLACVTLGLYAAVRWQKSPQFKWAILIGMATGGAVLCKWGLGLMPLAFMGLALLISGTQQFTSRAKHIVVAALISATIVAPWIVFIYTQFPTEAGYVLAYNTLNHVTEATDTPGTGYLFYWLTFPELYSTLFRALLPIALVVWLLKVHGTKRWLPVISIAFVYAFFTITASKMEHFVLGVSPFIWVILGLAVSVFVRYVLVNTILNRLNVSVILIVLLTGISVFYISHKPYRLWSARNNTPQCEAIQHEQRIKTLATNFYAQHHKVALYNLPPWDHARLMFYCRNCLGYDSNLSAAAIDSITAAGYSSIDFDSINDTLR